MRREKQKRRKTPCGAVTKITLAMAIMCMFVAGKAVAQNSTDIISFTFTGIYGKAFIDTENAGVWAAASPETDLSAITPEITVSTGAEIDPDPESGESQDFTNPVTYTVTNGGDSKEWTVTITKYETVTVTSDQPFNESFENNSGTRAFWLYENSSTAFAPEYLNTIIDGFQAHSGDKMAVIEDSYTLTSPVFNIAGLQDAHLSFMLRNNCLGNLGKLHVGYQVGDGEPFLIETIVQQYSQWTRITVNLPESTPEMEEYKIVFAEEGFGVVIDDVTVGEVPACVPPFALTATNITGTGAHIEWLQPGHSSGWEFGYGTANVPPEHPETINTRRKDLSDLTPGTTYNVFVRTKCDGGSTSDWSKISFTTECDAIPVDDERPFLETFEDSSTTRNCWQNQTLLGNTQWVFKDDPTDPALAYFNDPSEGSARFISPQLQLDEQYAYQLTADGKAKILKIYFFESGTNAEWTLLSEVEKSSLTVFEESLILPVHATGTYRLAFEAKEVAEIDDVFVETIACPEPQNLVVSNITDTKATIEWEQPGAAIEWQYTILDPETTPSFNWSMQPHRDYNAGSSIELTGLDAETEYTLYVRTKCGTDSYSDVSTITFVTGCEAIAVTEDNPFEEGFEDVSDTRDCWRVINNNNDEKTWNPSGSSSNYYQYEYSETKAADDYLFSPGLQLSAGTYIVSFDYETDGFPGLPENLEVQYGTAATVEAMTNDICDMPNIISEGFTEKVNYITIENEGVYYIGFHCYSDVDQYFLNIDNVTVAVAPGCIPPQNLVVSNVTTTGATFSWEHFGNTAPEGWQYGYNQSSTTAPEYPSGQENNSFTLNGLTPGTTYYFWVRAKCGEGEFSEFSEWANVEFTTECAAIGVDHENPFEETFNNDSGSGDGSETKICWRSEFVEGNLEWNNTNNNPFLVGIGTTKFVSPALDISGYGDTAIILSFDYSHIGAPLKLYYKTANNQPWTPLKVYDDADGGDHDDMLALPSPSAEYKIAFEFNAQGFDEDGDPISAAGFDNVTVAVAAACPAVTDLVATNVTDSSATISFTNWGSNTDWQCVVSATALSDPSSGHIQPTTENPFTITRLDPDDDESTLDANTMYYVYVRAKCGEDEDEVSEWEETTFVTGCEAIAELPWEEDFDDYAAGTSSFPECWRAATKYNNYPYIVNTSSSSPAHYFSSPNSLKFAGNNSPTAVTPAFAADIHSLMVTFQLQKEGPKSGSFEVGVMSNPIDTSTFELVQTINPTDNSYYKYTVYFSNTTLTGENNYIAFRQNSPATDCYYWLDDVKVETISGCIPPQNLIVSDITHTSATVSFTNVGGGNNAWRYVVSEIELDDPSFGDPQNATSTTISLTGLEANNDYFVYVRKQCGASEASVWAGTDFHTLCEPYVVTEQDPFVEIFEQDVSPTLECWSFTEESHWNLEQGNDVTIVHAHTGFQNAWNNSDMNNDMLISPVLDLTRVSAAKLSYWFSQDGAPGYQEFLTVYYRTNPDQEWVSLKHYPDIYNSWTLDSIELPYPSATYQIAFAHSWDPTAAPAVGITLDDVIVEATTPQGETYNIEYRVEGENGTVSGPRSKCEGDTVIVTAIPNEGYQLGTLTYTYNGNTENIDRETMSFEMPRYDVTVTAAFRSNDAPTYQIHYEVDGGHGNLTGPESAAQGENINVDAHPEDGYQLTTLELISDGETTDIFESRQFEMPGHEVTVKGTFGATPTGVEAVAGVDSKLFPNPVRDLLNIESSQPMTGYEVIAVTGQLIDRRSVDGSSTAVYHVGNLPDGNYIIRIFTDETVMTRRFVVRK